MQRIAATLCLFLLGCASLQAAADDAVPKPAATDPRFFLGSGGNIISTAATAVSNVLDATPTIITNGASALTSAASALTNAGALAEDVIGMHTGIHQKIKDSYLTSFALLNDIVKTLNSLHIAGSNLAAGVASTAATGIIDAIKEDLSKVSGLIVDLVGEFGRAVGNGVGVLATLKGPLLEISPVGLGFNVLNLELAKLIKFLQGAADVSVAHPIQQAALQPLIAKFTLLKNALEALQGLLTGPQGALLGAIDGALGAISGLAGAGNAVVGAAGAAANALTGATGNVAGLAGQVNQALGLLGPFINGLTGLLG